MFPYDNLDTPPNSYEILSRTETTEKIHQDQINRKQQNTYKNIKIEKRIMNDDVSDFLLFFLYEIFHPSVPTKFTSYILCSVSYYFGCAFVEFPLISRVQLTRTVIGK